MNYLFLINVSMFRNSKFEQICFLEEFSTELSKTKCLNFVFPFVHNEILWRTMINPHESNIKNIIAKIFLFQWIGRDDL